MARLNREYFEFLRSLSPREENVYYELLEQDTEDKKALEESGGAWDQETDSQALRYLRNKRAFRQEPQAVLQTSDAEGATGESTSSDTDPDGSDSDTEEEDDEDNDSIVTNYFDATSSSVPVEGRGRDTSKAIQKFSESSFRRIRSEETGGLFADIQFGYIRGKPCLVKRLVDSTTSNDQQLMEFLEKLASLNHRNVVSLVGMMVMDEDIKGGRIRLIYNFEEDEISLQRFMRSRDPSLPKGPATFGKISLDILGAMEYLYTNNIVHGSLSSYCVVMRRAVKAYNDGGIRRKPKLHVNAFIADHGVSGLGPAKNSAGFQKISTGKTVRLRWTPKELLLETSLITSSKPADVWAFGVILWEMWSDGAVPYGKQRRIVDIEEDIRKDCSPLTIRNMKRTLPRNILGILESIFTEAENRPTFHGLQSDFIDFKEEARKKKMLRCAQQLILRPIGRLVAPPRPRPMNVTAQGSQKKPGGNGRGRRHFSDGKN